MTDEELEAASDPHWWSTTESPKAWMSIRDADLWEELLHRMASLRADRELRVLEWGAGRSTLWYTSFLDALNARYRWLAIEHDREYFEATLTRPLAARSNATTRGCEESIGMLKELLSTYSLLAVSFDAGLLQPFMKAHEGDRHADLDDYVALPSEMGFTPDIVVVDGRKRRRCVEAAAAIVDPEGVVLLHDAWRRYYQCSWEAFASHRRFGDEWWIGSQRWTNFEDVLPWYAFLEPPEPRSYTTP